MAKTMTPSQKSMTSGQIDKAVASYRALLEKHASEFSSEAVQTVLGQEEFAKEQFSLFRQRVEVISKMIIRRANPDRTLTPQQVLDATGRKQYTDKEVVEGMPRGEGEGEINVYFFQPEPWEYTRKGFISNDDLEKCFERRGIVRDPYAQADVNKEDPAFADKHPNGTYWKDSNGKWCYSVFSRWRGGRFVDVIRGDDGWDGGWWFAGVCK